MGFFSLELGKKTLQTHQMAIDVTGHNIANANTEGYSRQIGTVVSEVMKDKDFGTIGTGSSVLSITRARNTFLDDRMIKEVQEKAKWETREINLKHVQYILNEPSDESLRNTLDQFWKSLHDLSQSPEDRSIRITVKERAIDLANSITNSYEQIEALRKDIDNNIGVKVDSVNSSLKQIADLNAQIQRLEANRKEANDLRDKRDLIVENLSKMVNIQVTRGEREFSVIIGGRTAVQGDSYKEMKIVKDSRVNEGMSQIKWEDTDRDVYITNGELLALQELRDDDMVNYFEYLDRLAIGVIDRVNEVQNSGYDINKQKGVNFFGEFQTYEETLDIDSDGLLEASIYRISGTNSIMETDDMPLSQDQEISSYTGIIEVNGMQITYNTDKDTLKDISEKINNANAGIVTAISPDNKFILRADSESGYVIKSIEDKQGTLLQDLGILAKGKTLFDYEKTDTLNDISAERLSKPKEKAATRIYVSLDDVDKLAAARGREKISGTSVFSETAVLDGQTGITSNTTGKIKINGKEIDYDTTKDSLKNIADRINVNSNLGVEAIVESGKLVLKALAAKNNIVDSIEDTSGTLLQELGLIDASGGFTKEVEPNKAGDGSNALKMSELKYQKSIGKYTYSDYFESMISDVGITSQQATRFVETQDILISNLEQRRQSEIGVSLDEEMTNMIRYQHGYNAAAKFINTVNQMYDTLINKI